MAMILAQNLMAEGRIEGLLEARFGNAGIGLLPEIRRITDIDKLQALLEAVRHAETMDGVRQAIRG